MRAPPNPPDARAADAVLHLLRQGHAAGSRALGRQQQPGRRQHGRRHQQRSRAASALGAVAAGSATAAACPAAAAAASGPRHAGQRAPASFSSSASSSAGGLVAPRSPDWRRGGGMAGRVGRRRRVGQRRCAERRHRCARRRHRCARRDAGRLSLARLCLARLCESLPDRASLRHRDRQHGHGRGLAQRRLHRQPVQGPAPLRLYRAEPLPRQLRARRRGPAGAGASGPDVREAGLRADARRRPDQRNLPVREPQVDEPEGRDLRRRGPDAGADGGGHTHGRLLRQRDRRLRRSQGRARRERQLRPRHAQQCRDGDAAGAGGALRVCEPDVRRLLEEQLARCNLRRHRLLLHLLQGGGPHGHKLDPRFGPRDVRLHRRNLRTVRPRHGRAAAAAPAARGAGAAARPLFPVRPASARGRSADSSRLRPRGRARGHAPATPAVRLRLRRRTHHDRARSHTCSNARSSARSHARGSARSEPGRLQLPVQRGLVPPIHGPLSKREQLVGPARAHASNMCARVCYGPTVPTESVCEMFLSHLSVSVSAAVSLPGASRRHLAP
mmetsp:Transcript_34521/g.108729  ORF Transcript_34521/g.108729 Transcript_34521/m.108729 type:complete len:557 (-) Transcript_34521:22-1692(-)